MNKLAQKLIVVGTCFFTITSLPIEGKDIMKPMLYKNESGRQKSFASYNRAMTLWTVPYQDEWVSTSYGKTHIVVSGPTSAPPVFLLPGLFADATMWYANAGALSKRYRVYAVDLITYGGKDEPSGKQVGTESDYIAWFNEIRAYYKYQKVVFVGLSYGSWLTLEIAREKPDWVEAAVLLDPSTTFISMGRGIFWRGLWNFVLFPSRKNYSRFMNWMGGGYSDTKADIWFEHMLDVMELGSTKMNQVPQHRIYQPNELTNVRMPFLVLSGGKPIIYRNPEKFAAAAQKALPHAEVEVVPGTGHSLNIEKAEYINSRILVFLDKVFAQRKTAK